MIQGVNAQINDSPFVSGDRIYVGGTDNTAYCVDLASGTKVWDPPANLGDQKSTIIWSSPNIIDDTMVIGVGSFQVFFNGPYDFKGSIVSVNATDGSTRVEDLRHGRQHDLGERRVRVGVGRYRYQARLHVHRHRAGLQHARRAPSDSMLAMEYANGRDQMVAPVHRQRRLHVVSQAMTGTWARACTSSRRAAKSSSAGATRPGTTTLSTATLATSCGAKCSPRAAAPAASWRRPPWRTASFTCTRTTASPRTSAARDPDPDLAFALDAATGNIIWQTAMTPGCVRRNRHRQRAHVLHHPRWHHPRARDRRWSRALERPHDPRREQGRRRRVGRRRNGVRRRRVGLGDRSRARRAARCVRVCARRPRDAALSQRLSYSMVTVVCTVTFSPSNAGTCASRMCATMQPAMGVPRKIDPGSRTAVVTRPLEAKVTATRVRP